MGRATVAKFGERYELISRIGSGDTGKVWLAHDEELGSRPVAIKIMHPHVLPDKGDVARFEREIRFVTMLDHPNIATVYATGTYDDAPFMVIEYLTGHDLEKALPGADAEHISGIARDVCSGLAYAHRQGVLHRDIKPGNLFLCESGQVKITGFGLARAVGGTALSTTGVLVGTFAYRAPERWRGEPPSFSNDVWAAGCPPTARGDEIASSSRPAPRCSCWPRDRSPHGGSALPSKSRNSRCAAPRCLSRAASPPGKPRLPPRPRPGLAPSPHPRRGLPRPRAAFRSASPAASPATPSSAVPGTSLATSPVRSVSASPVSSTAADAVSPAPADPVSSPPPDPASSPPADPAGPPPATPPAGGSSPGTLPTTTVPDVVGMTFSQAKQLLESEGFTVKGKHTGSGQVVTGANPAGEAAAGSKITVAYGTAKR
jgi:serine/threonine-protein kinase